MKVLGLMFADFAAGFWGGPSALAKSIGTRSIIDHALARFAHIEGLADRCLLVQPRDLDAARAAIDRAAGGAISVLPLDDGRRPRRALFRAARKWSMRAWRGGILGTTYFDEYAEPRLALRALQHLNADAVLCLDAAMPALDVSLAGQMLARMRENREEAPFVFTQAPPGLAGVLLQAEALEDLVRHDLPIGLRLSYRPEFPGGDPINRPPCVPVSRTVQQLHARLTGDTRCSRDCLAAAFAQAGECADAQAICAAVRSAPDCWTADLPLETEIELTTADPLPETHLRARGARAPQRCLADAAALRPIGAELARLDDRLIVLGGHGDPLQHREFATVCRDLRAAGVCGLAVATPLVDLADEQLAALREAQVDVLHVFLDADQPDTYRRVQGRDAFEQVVANVERVEHMRRSHGSPFPLIVPNLTRCQATLPEMERFFDRWVQKVGWATISGYSTSAGALPADNLLTLTPPARRPCRRLSGRLLLLADGTAAACSEVPDGGLRFGDWRSEGLVRIWRGAARAELQAVHARGALQNLPCARCTEWHRE